MVLKRVLFFWYSTTTAACLLLDFLDGKRFFHGRRGGGRCCGLVVYCWSSLGGRRFGAGLDGSCLDHRKGYTLFRVLLIGIGQNLLFEEGRSVSIQKANRQASRIIIDLTILVVLLFFFGTCHFHVFFDFLVVLDFFQILGQRLQIGPIEFLGVFLDSLAGCPVGHARHHFLGELLEMNQRLEFRRKSFQDCFLVQILPQTLVTHRQRGSPAHGGVVGSLASSQFVRSRRRLADSGLVGLDGSGHRTPVLGCLGTGTLVALVLFHGQFAAVVLSGSLRFQSDPNFQNLVLELVVAVLAGGNAVLPSDSAIDQVKGLVPGVVGLVGGGGRLGSSGLFDALENLSEEVFPFLVSNQMLDPRKESSFSLTVHIT
mmetsp:Transcript_22203/g.54982  ORF Transcript_22203/g.54982 Transcript_22203/m.54982 type:complete len:371 (+) Transcript_22203:192-1304(+)